MCNAGWCLVDFISQFVSDFFPILLRCDSINIKRRPPCVAWTRRGPRLKSGRRAPEKQEQSKARIRASLEWEHQTMVRIRCHRSGFSNRPSKSNDSSIFSLRHLSFSSFSRKTWIHKHPKCLCLLITLHCLRRRFDGKILEKKWKTNMPPSLFMSQKIRKSAFIQFNGVVERRGGWKKSVPRTQFNVTCDIFGIEIEQWAATTIRLLNQIYGRENV